MARKEFISLNIYKAIGPDEIHQRMLKELVDYVTIPLFFIMKKSLVVGIVPTDWKLANTKTLSSEKVQKT